MLSGRPCQIFILDHLGRYPGQPVDSAGLHGEDGADIQLINCRFIGSQRTQSKPISSADIRAETDEGERYSGQRRCVGVVANNCPILLHTDLGDELIGEMDSRNLK